MKNQKGFAVLEGLLILVIVALIGGVGWYVWNAKQNADANLSNADKSNSATANFSKKPTAQSTQTKEYCSDYEKLCFQYPDNWRFSVLETADPNLKGALIKSPQNTVTVEFRPLIRGVGGNCDPNTCFVDVISIDKVANSNSLKIVKGVYHADTVFYPIYYLSTDDQINIYKLSPGKSVDVGFFGGYYASKNHPDVKGSLRVALPEATSLKFKSVAEAKTWFSSVDFNQVSKIFATVHYR